MASYSVVFLLMLGWLALIWSLSFSLTRAVFISSKNGVLSLRKPTSPLPAPTDGEPTRIILICTPSGFWQEYINKFLGEWRQVDFEDGSFMNDISGEKKGVIYVMIWNHDLIFGSSDKDRVVEKLQKLEKLLSDDHSVLIVADTLPIFHLSRDIGHVSEYPPDPSLLYRLGRLFAKFEVFTLGEHSNDSFPRPTNTATECGQNGCTESCAVKRQARFGMQWLASTQDERIQLYALAYGGFANPRRTAVLSSLISRGLVQVDASSRPELNDLIGLRDLDFADYIRNNLNHDELEAWRKEGHGNIWQRVWPPLTVVAVLALLFFLNANPEALTVLVALLGASVGAAPVATSLARSWRSSSQSDASD